MNTKYRIKMSGILKNDKIMDHYEIYSELTSLESENESLREEIKLLKEITNILKDALLDLQVNRFVNIQSVLDITNSTHSTVEK